MSPCESEISVSDILDEESFFFAIPVARTKSESHLPEQTFQSKSVLRNRAPNTKIAAFTKFILAFLICHIPYIAVFCL